MRQTSLRSVRLSALLLVVALPAVASAAATLELYGTFHSMGVIVTLTPGDDPDLDAVASVSYRTGGAAFAAGHPLVRTSATQFVGSLLWLSPGVTYDVRVEFDDPDGALHGQSVQLGASTRPEITIPSPTASLVASPSGSGTSCTQTTPCALATAMNQVQAGEEVVMMGGVYRTGGLSLPHSGAPGSPIVIRAEDGESPVLDGSDPEDFTWIYEGGGVYSTTVNVADTHLVVVDGERLYPYQSLTDLQALVWDIPGFHADGDSLWVRLAGDADPNPAEVAVSRFNHALYLDQDFVFVLGLTFRFYGQGSWAKAIYVNDASDTLVRGCVFTTCDLGVGIKRESHRTVIEDNVFTDTIFDWPWDAVKSGSHLETGGVRLYDPMTGRGTVIRRNTFSDDFDGFGVCPSSDTGTTCETDVYDNLGYDLGDDGFETDGYCSNVRIWGNTFHDVLVGISLAPVYHGPVYAVRNLIHHTGAGNSDYTGTCFKLNSGYSTSGPMLLYHNTCDAALPGNDAFAIKSPGTWTDLVARNNIWSATRYALSNANTSQPVDLDWDALFTTMPDELAWWNGHGHLRTLAELRAATGQELAGMHSEPGFAGPGYQLEPTSNLVDAGVPLPGINHDFAGAAPDMGAFEAVEVIFTDGFESGDTSAW